MLSFVGDAVYSLLVREMLAGELCRSSQLHAESAKWVKAASQAAAFRAIEPHLTEEEIAVYKRGRNAHNNHKPRRAETADYRTATGIEALFGYLYLSGEDERITYLFDIIRRAEP